MDNKQKKITILLCGIGGYGAIYGNALLDNANKHYQVVGIVDPCASKYKRIDEFIAKGTHIYESMEACYKHNRVDLCIVSTPIQFHKEQSIYAMEHQSHVLCEKPIAGSLEEAYKMIEVSERTGKMLAIGYQWSFIDVILQLKRDLLSGMYGAVHKMKYITLWRRSEGYFTRNNWAGRRQDKQGRWVNDSVLHNATAHHLHNLLFLAGKTLDESLEIKASDYEVYRVNTIETYDTAFAKFYGENDVLLFAVASHTVQESSGPFFQIETEKGMITYDIRKQLIGKLDDGSEKRYGTLEIDESIEGEMKKLQVCIDYCLDEKIESVEIPCRGTTAISQLACVSMIETVTMPHTESIKRTEDHLGLYLEGLEKIAKQCYKAMKLPCEMDISLTE